MPIYKGMKKATLKAIEEGRIAYRCTNQHGSPCNGGSIVEFEPDGWAKKIEDPIIDCQRGYHVTREPHRWKGCRVFVVETDRAVTAKEKQAHRTFRILGEVLHKECIDPKILVRISFTLSGENLSLEELSGANLSCANLYCADLCGSSLGYADLCGAILMGARLVGANLSCANLIGANLIGANLVGATLSCATLIDANLRGTNLSGANLFSADLSGANLRGAYLNNANLIGAYLVGANLSGAYLYGANLSGARMPDGSVHS